MTVNVFRQRFLIFLVILLPFVLIINIYLFNQNQNLKSKAEQSQTLPTPPDGYQWQIVFRDEFDGDSIDLNKWEVIGDEPRRDGWWLREDAYLDGQGNLVLRTKKDGDRYSSGAIRSRGRFEHTFGYYEARVTFPSQVGHWPAFWLFTSGVHNVDGSGRDGTEIDIVEKPWVGDFVHQALHWDGYGSSHQFANQTEISIPGISRGWHTVGLDWRPDNYTFYINGVATWVTNAGGVSQVPQYIKLTDEIGDWAGDINNATLPDYFKVDYVRVYDLVAIETSTLQPSSSPTTTLTQDPVVEPTTNSTPTTAPTGISFARCQQIKIYDDNWNELTSLELQDLNAGDQIYLGAVGQASNGLFTAARFIVNQITRDQVEQKIPGTDEFFDIYIIPDNLNTFELMVEMYHPDFGWVR